MPPTPILRHSHHWDKVFWSCFKSYAARAQPVNPTKQAPKSLTRSSNSSDKIQLDDFLNGITVKAHTLLSESSLFDYAQPSPTQEEFGDRIANVNNVLHDLTRVFAVGGGWANSEQVRLFGRMLERLTSIPRPQNRFYDNWVRLAYYPALRLFYASGIAAIDRLQYLSFKYFTSEVKCHDQVGDYQKISLVNLLIPEHVFSRDTRKWLPNVIAHRAPDSAYLEKSLRPIFQSDIPDDYTYTRTFDRFEYYLALVYRTANSGEKWVPTGSFVWRDRPHIFDVVQQEIEMEGDGWPLVRVGCFASAEALLDVKQRADEYIMGARYRERLR